MSGSGGVSVGWVGRQVNRVAIGLVLNEAVHVAISGVVPDMLGGDVHGVAMRSVFVVGISVGVVVASTGGVAADEADPEVGGGAADGARGFNSSSVMMMVVVRAREGEGERGRLRVSAYRTARTSPFLKTGAVEDVLAEDGQEARRFVHAFEADGAGRELD